MQACTIERMDRAIEQLADPLLSTQHQSLVERRRDVGRPFMLFVVGVGKAGKSSLINAIVGADVAPKAIVPLTWKIDTYQRSDTPRAVLRWDDGRETTHSLDEAKSLCATEEARARTADADGLLYTGAIVEARWHLPDIDLPSTVQIVDTPGLHQIRANLRDDPKAKRFRPLVASSPDLLGLAQIYLNKADAVLWVLDGNALAGVSGKAIADLAFYKRDQHAVINKIDTLGGVTSEEVEAHAEGLFGGLFGRYFAVSAKRARKEPDQWGMPSLMRFIKEEFIQQAAQKKMHASNTLVQVELEAAQEIATAEAARLSDAITDLNEAHAEISARLNERRATHDQAIQRDITNAFASSARTISAGFAQQVTSATFGEARRLFLTKVPERECVAIVEREACAADDALTVDARLTYGRLAIRGGAYDFAGRSSSTQMLLRSVDLKPFSFRAEKLTPSISADLRRWRAADSGKMSNAWEVLKKLASGTSRWERRATALRSEMESVGQDLQYRGCEAMANCLKSRLEQWQASAKRMVVEALGHDLGAATERAEALQQLSEWMRDERRTPLVLLPILDRMRDQ